jgi:hypothetical protein
MLLPVGQMQWSTQSRGDLEAVLKLPDPTLHSTIKVVSGEATSRVLPLRLKTSSQKRNFDCMRMEVFGVFPR